MELCKRGVAIESMQDGVKFYEVISPRELFVLLEEKLKKFKNILPQMLGMVNGVEHKPSMYFYEGFEEVKEIYRDMLKE